MNKYILIFILFVFAPVFSFGAEPVAEEPLFDAGKPPMLVRAFGLTYPVYKPQESPESYRLYLLFGPYSPLNLCSSDMCFSDFFGPKKRYFVNIGLEYQLLNYALGSFGVKAGSGFFFASAKGIFSGTSTRSRDTVVFVVLPVELLMVATFNVWKEQVLVPYAEGGAAYFGFFQHKTNSNPLSGGRANFVMGAGIKVLLDWIDYRSAWKLDSSHGINNTYFTIYYRYVLALDRGRSMDFTGSVFMAGISFDM